MFMARVRSEGMTEQTFETLRPRPRRYALAVSCLLIGWVALLWAAHLGWHPPLRLPSTPALTLHPRAGVNLAPAALDNPALVRALANAGIRWVRVEMSWAEVEPAPGMYRWATWDARLTRLRRLDITPVLVLNTSPAWARAAVDRNLPTAPPARPEDFARFAAAVAQRYSTLVRYYQIWDEPNIAPHWGNREADPLGYLRLLQAAASALRENDPDAVILSAALAPTLDPGRVNYNDLNYLEALYRLGAQVWFDVLAWQGYGFDRPPEDPPAADRLNFRRWELARAIMQRYGDEATALWLTGFGWNATLTASTTPWKRVHPDEQADYLRRAFAWVEAYAPWVGPMFWVHAYPAAPSTDLRWGFALWDPDGTPRGVWRSLVSQAAAMVLPPGQHPFPLPCPLMPFQCREPDRPISYPVVLNRAQGPVTIPFRGTGIVLEVAAGPHWQTIWVQVDGQPASALPRDGNGRAYLNLYRPRGTSVRVLVTRDLPYGDHTLTLIPGPGDPVWPLVRLIVLGPDQQRPWLRGLPFLLVGIIALAVGWRLMSSPPTLRIPFPPPAIGGLFLVVALIPFTERLVRVGNTTYVLPEVALLATGLVGTGYALFRWAHRDTWPVWTVTLPARRSLLFLTLVVAAMIVGLTQAPQVGPGLTALRAQVLFPAALFVLWRGLPAPPRTRAVYALLCGMAVLAFWALGDVLGGRAVWPEGLPRARAFFGSPNHLALVLVRGVPFALLIAMRPHSRWVGGALSALLLAALLATGSRAAWGLALPAALLALSWPGRHRPGLIAAAGAIGVGVLLFLARDTASWQQRWYIWGGVLRWISDRPWVGGGLGQFPYVYPHYALPEAWREPLLYHAHNGLLTTAAVLGVPAALVLAWWVGHALSASPQDWVARGARASLWAGVAFGLVDAFWALNDLAYLSALALAFISPPPSTKEPIHR